MTEIKDLIEISILCCVSCCMNSFEESILIVIWASNKIGVIFVLTETKLQLKFARLDKKFHETPTSLCALKMRMVYIMLLHVLRDQVVTWVATSSVIRRAPYTILPWSPV